MDYGNYTLYVIKALHPDNISLQSTNVRDVKKIEKSKAGCVQKGRAIADPAFLS
jgi:hypothetical protein